MNPKDYVLSVRIKGDKEGPQTGDVVLNGSAINEWLPRTDYEAGDVIVYNNQFYQSIDNQTSGSEFDRTLWNQIGIPDIVVPEFKTNTEYAKGQLVVHDGKLYRSKNNFTSSVRFYEDDWENVSGEVYTFTSEDRSVAITLNDSTVDFSVGTIINKTKQDLQDQIDEKVDKVVGKGLSANDYTAEDKAKLTGLLEILKLGNNLTLDADGTLSAGFSISFDTSLSKTSTNAVQNKVITAKIEGIEADVADNSSDISDLESDVANVKIDVADIKTDITDINADITSLTSDLANKVDVQTGKDLSSNDFTDAYQTKLNQLVSIFTLGDNLSLVDNKLSAVDTHVELANTTGSSTTKGMTQAAITNAIASASSGITTALAPVATTGDYDDLINTPTIDTVLSNTSPNAVENRAIKDALDLKADDSALAVVAKSGNYNDLSNKPVIDTAVSATSTNLVTNKAITSYVDTEIGSLATVASSGSYNDLSNRPTIGNGRIEVFDSENNSLFDFQTNQQSAASFIVPSADTSTLGLVKLDNATSTTSTNPVQNKVITNFVNSSINSNSAHYLTKDAAGNAFATKAELTAATTFYYAGAAFTPTKNDYVVVITDESQSDAQTRYVAQQSGSSIVWAFQYKVNDKPFTTAQNNAINSGMAAADKTKLDGIASGAEVNVQADWSQTNASEDSYIKNKPSLATVATSGKYSDLSGTPTIPTVNNATLTIQQNGTTVKTFTANASSNVTANITVPTFSYDSSTQTLTITTT